MLSFANPEHHWNQNRLRLDIFLDMFPLLKYMLVFILLTHFTHGLYPFDSFRLPPKPKIRINSTAVLPGIFRATLLRVTPSKNSDASSVVTSVNNIVDVPINRATLLQVTPFSNVVPISTSILFTKLASFAELPKIPEKLGSVNQSAGNTDLTDNCACNTEKSIYTSYEPAVDTAVSTSPMPQVEGGKKDVQNHLSSLIPSVSNISFSKLPVSITEKKTITVTKTMIKPFTNYKTVYPSCLKMKKVSVVCALNLVTITPTPSITRKKTRDVKSYEVGEQSPEYVDGYTNQQITAMTTHQTTADSTTTYERNNNYLEPSELDNEFEELPNGKLDNYELSPTPELKDTSKLLGHKPAEIIQALLLGEPKIEFVTEFIPSITVQPSTNYATTVTIIASRCLPRDLSSLPLCTKFPKMPVFPITVYSSGRQLLYGQFWGKDH